MPSNLVKEADVQIGKYARIERERRFLLHGLPLGLSSVSPHTTIRDRYIHHTRFRLRYMTASDTNTITYKLTQKYVHSPGNFASVVITNTYLTEQEYGTFVTLPAAELRKDRYRYSVDGLHYAVDSFHGQWAGLFLAEIEVASDHDLSAFLPPAFVLAEVTGEAAFTGGMLCRSTATEVQDVIKRTLERKPT